MPPRQVVSRFTKLRQRRALRGLGTAEALLGRGSRGLRITALDVL